MVKTANGKKGGLLKGNSHANGGIKAVVTDDGNRPVELEGEEAIVNKKSMRDQKRYRVEGTPRQIVSAINSLNGNGVVIENGGKLTDLQSGRTQIMKDGGLIDNSFDYLWFLKWHLA